MEPLLSQYHYILMSLKLKMYIPNYCTITD